LKTQNHVTVSVSIDISLGNWIRKEKSRAQERLATGIMEAVEESSEKASPKRLIFV
jgi:hypothetical protein